MKLHFLILLILVFSIGFSQEKNMISNKSYGYQFKSPQGWVHEDLQNGSHAFGSTKITGLLAVMTHDFNNKNEVKRVVEVEGIQEEGIQLMPAGAITTFTNNGLTGVFEGYVNGEAVKASVISLFSPHGGGVSIFAITSKEKFDDSYKALAKNMANSVVFSKPVKSKLAIQWKQFLTNKKLTYYNTTDDVAEKMIYILYDNGWFVFLDESFYGSTDQYTDHSFSFSSLSTNKNAGEWQIQADDHNAILSLHYNNGGVTELSLQIKEGSSSQVLLNGKRFFTESIR